MAPEIYQGIVAYQSGDSTAAWTLVQKFTPLLKHYAFILHREDGFEDLQCYFLSLLKTLSLERLSSTSDGAIIKYIAISIRHEYIEQAKAKAKEGVVTYIDDLTLSLFLTVPFSWLPKMFTYLSLLTFCSSYLDTVGVHYFGKTGSDHRERRFGKYRIGYGAVHGIGVTMESRNCYHYSHYHEWRKWALPAGYRSQQR